MKKLLVLLLSAMCAAGLAANVGAEPTFEEERQIPKASTAPVIDGIMSEGEWANALAIIMNSDTTEQIVGDGNFAKCPDAVYYWMWDDAGIYFFGNVTDSTEPRISHTFGNGHYNSGDGIQFCIYPNIYDFGSENKTGLFFWDLVIANNGEAACGEHFPYGTWDHMNNQWGTHMNQVITVGAKDGSNYQIEAFFPAELWTVTDTPLYVEEGARFALANVLMEENSNGEQALFVDTAWFHAPMSNKYTLVNTPAGIQPEAPETQAPETQAPETQAPETQAPETQAPETQAPETAAPETQVPETQAPETQAPETEAPEAPADVVKLNDYATIIKGEAVTADVTLAFDGNKDTGTAFGGADSDHWAGIKLDQPTVLSYVSLLSGQIARPDRIFLAEIEGSNDGINWEPILQLGDVYAEYEDYANDVWGADNYAMWVEYAFDGGADEYGDEDAAEPKAYTYYRVFNTDNDNWGEIEFWGTIVEEAPEATVEFDLVDTVAQAGGTVEVTINAAAGIPANSFALYELTYDPAVLTFVEFTGFGEIVTDSFFGTEAVDNELKTIMFAYENAAEFEGLVAKIKFAVNADAAEGTTEVTMKALVKNDSEVIEAAVDGAVIEVKAAGTYVPGDIDGNGAVDLQDALNLFQYSMMPDIYELTYAGNIDYVADGNIDILDALYLFQSSMMPDIYPIY